MTILSYGLTFPKGQVSERYCGDKLVPALHIGSHMIYISQKQFAGSTADFSSRGFDLALTVDGEIFQVRSYLDQPGDLTIINPKSARTSIHARQLVDYLASVLGGRRMFFYDGRCETYREINVPTLKFKAGENRPVAPASRIPSAKSLKTFKLQLRAISQITTFGKPTSHCG